MRREERLELAALTPRGRIDHPARGVGKELVDAGVIAALVGRAGLLVQDRAVGRIAMALLVVGVVVVVAIVLVLLPHVLLPGGIPRHAFRLAEALDHVLDRQADPGLRIATRATAIGLHDAPRHADRKGRQGGESQSQYRHICFSFHGGLPTRHPAPFARVGVLRMVGGRGPPVQRETAVSGVLVHWGAVRREQ